MIGAFLAFGVNGNVTVPADLAYRAISISLPMILRVVQYFQLRLTIGRWKHSDHDQPR